MRAMNRFAKSLLTSAALGAASLLPAHAEIDVVALKTAIEASVEADYPGLDALYKEIHAHPEIAFQEVKTAAQIGRRDARARLRRHREGRQDRAGGDLQKWRGPHHHGPHRARRAADGREDRSCLCEPRQDHLERAGNLRRPQLRPRYPHGELGRDGQDAARPEGQVAGHPDVHRPAGRRDGVGRQGHAGGRPVHAIWQARLRVCPA